MDPHVGRIFNDFLDRRAQGERSGEDDLLSAHPEYVVVILDRGALPADFVRHVLRQMLRGLAAAHEEVLIHRDIMPTNALLHQMPPHALNDSGARKHGSDSVLVEIGGFGLARMISSGARIIMPDSTFGTKNISP